MIDMEKVLAYKTQQGYADCHETLAEHDKQIRADIIKIIDEELKEVRHCLELAKKQMLIDYVYIACEHLDNIDKLKEHNNE